MLVRRDKRRKGDGVAYTLEQSLQSALTRLPADLVPARACQPQRKDTECHNYAEFKDAADNKTGFIKAMWCGDEACEAKVKDELEVTSRCMPFDMEPIDDKCAICGKKAEKLVYWGKAY